MIFYDIEDTVYFCLGVWVIGFVLCLVWFSVFICFLCLVCFSFFHVFRLHMSLFLYTIFCVCVF